MNMFSRRETNVLKAAPLTPPELMAEGIQRARRMYRDASEELFQLCYLIQVTGRLPDPVLLTETLVHYRHARALTEALNIQAAYVRDGDTLAGTPVQPG